MAFGDIVNQVPAVFLTIHATAFLIGAFILVFAAASQRALAGAPVRAR